MLVRQKRTFQFSSAYNEDVSKGTKSWLRRTFLKETDFSDTKSWVKAAGVATESFASRHFVQFPRRPFFSQPVNARFL